MTNDLRLQKFIADCGVVSRRKAEEYIRDGRVKVNDEVVTEMGIKVDPSKDIVQVDDMVVEMTDQEKVYILLNKPRGYVTTVYDPEGRETVLDLIKGIPTRIFPVGRLDYLSEGLLILTNDGELTNMIIHPKYEVNKVYEVKVFGRVTEAILKRLKMGERVEGELLKPSYVRIIGELPKKTWIEFRLTEGKNREIRKLCEAVGLTIDKLKRVAIEGLTINHLKPGEYEILSRKELLSKLGINEEGKKIRPFSYKSAKKTVSLAPKTRAAGKPGGRRKTVARLGNPADSPEFQRYRKEKYYSTLKQQKINEAKSAAATEQEDDEPNFNR